LPHWDNCFLDVKIPWISKLKKPVTDAPVMWFAPAIKIKKGGIQNGI
jgi:hypothetical protein